MNTVCAELFCLQSVSLSPTVSILNFLKMWSRLVLIKVKH